MNNINLLYTPAYSPEFNPIEETFSEIKRIFRKENDHSNLILSINNSINNFLDNRLGYFEDSPFIKINKEVRYATWQMNSCVGAVHASVINAYKKDLNAKDNFDYFLNSFAKCALPHGLFCYSEPRLLMQKKVVESKRKSNTISWI